MKTRITDDLIKNTPLPKGRGELIIRDKDVTGLCLRIRPGSKTWLLIKTVGGKRVKHTLGLYSDLSIEGAKQAVEPLIEKVEKGGSLKPEPINTATFESLIEKFFKWQEAGGSRKAKTPLAPKTVTEYERHLNIFCKPLHDKLLVMLDETDITNFLDELRETRKATAVDACKRTLGSYWKFVQKRVKGAEKNIVQDVDDYAAAAPRDRWLTEEELAALWRVTGDGRVYSSVVRLALLTGLRIGTEVGGLRWSEVDLDEAMIRIPASRSKNRHMIVQPLSEQAVAELRKLTHDSGKKYVFTADPEVEDPDKPQKYEASMKERDLLLERMEKVLGAERMQEIWDGEAVKGSGIARGKWVPHDLRRNVSTFVNERGFMPHVAEAILNHVSGDDTGKAGVAAVYNKAGYTDPQREALQAWADHVTALQVKPVLGVV